MLAACASVPTAEEYRAGTLAAITASNPAEVRDDRARFRQVFCGTLQRSGIGVNDADCERWLWRLADEPAPGPVSAPAAPAAPSSSLRAIVITGAFSDCFDEYALAFWSEARVLTARGYRVEVLPVSGRSSVEHNARQIAAEFADRGVRPDDRVVLIGYSKGALDALEFLATEPAAAAPVVALVSVSGPWRGSPAAGTARGAYSLFADAFGERCDPGDGGVLESLAPETRAAWFASHALPSDVAYFSLGAFTTDDRLARGAKPSWRYLALHDRWNDGQVAAASALIPGSTVLGFANADHWGVALNIEVSQPLIAKRRDSVPFPREQLLEAILLYVAEQLGPGT